MLQSRNVNKKEKTSETKYIILINSKNISSFNENLASANWDKIYELNEVEEIGDFFMDTLIENFNTSFPIVKSRFKKGLLSPIYFTKGIKESIKKEKNTIQ